jgi:hypothetical protein
MNKERELLERWLDDTIFEPEELDSLMEETRELLAQPEQEAVEDRIARWHRLGYEQGKKAQREPLSDLDVFTLYEEAEYIGFLAYRKGIKDAEKAHGITGGEELNTNPPSF